MSLKDAVELGMSSSPPCEECAAWRAHAEALARALEKAADTFADMKRTLELFGRFPLRDAMGIAEDASRAALARLPAQALAERRALEALAGPTRELFSFVHPKGPGWGMCFLCAKAGGQHDSTCPVGLLVVAFAALDAALGKG